MHIFSRRFPRISRRRRSLPDRSALFHQSPSGYVVVSAEGVIEETNHTFAAWLGEPRSALAGISFADVLTPADLPVYTAWITALHQGDEHPPHLTVDFRAADGRTMPALISAVHTAAPGLDLITVFPEPGRRRYERDLMEALEQAESAEAARGAAELLARERESLLETILDTVDVGVLVMDPQGREILANARMEASRSLGSPGEPQEFSSGTWPVYAADRITPLPEEQRPIGRAVAGESFAEQIVWIGTGQGQMAVSVSARALRGDGEFKGSVLAFSDVTQLVHALAAQGEFVANVSHELRTPLTSILGYLDMVLEEELPGTVESALQTAVRNAERLLQLITDLLTVAAGNEALDLQETELPPVLRAAVDSFGPRARINGVDFDVEVPADLHAVVDARRIRQVMENLISNAIKYSPDGGMVHVRAQRLAESVQIEVADSGLGMSTEDQELAFSRFFRSNSVLTAAIPGAGLGLVITRRIVEDHGGTIAVRSAAGSGTVFTVTLPAAGPNPGLQT